VKLFWLNDIQKSKKGLLKDENEKEDNCGERRTSYVALTLSDVYGGTVVKFEIDGLLLKNGL